jgi:hypothetical protein
MGTCPKGDGVSTFEEQASDYLRALRGKDRENAYHRLIELGADVIPLVAMSFKLETDPSIRSTLVNIAWRTDPSRALPFLKEALDDGEPGVWKEALDGLTALGGESALDVVRQARVRTVAEKSDWLDEAIQQIADSVSAAERAGQ